jgi:hypothetical protein
MELSAVAKEYGLLLTRAERSLVTQIPAGASAISDDLYGERMKALADARDVLDQMPDRQTTARQRRMEKAGMLKERLKVLRQMIPFLSPTAAKSLKAEMKQIAAQLASLEAGSGGGSGSAMPASAAATIEAPESGTDVEAAANTAQPAEKGEGQKQNAPPDSVLQGFGQKNGDSNSEDRQLKEAVEELKNLYKAVLAALKRKQQSGRDNGHLSASAPNLRGYTNIPDTTNRLTVKV